VANEVEDLAERGRAPTAVATDASGKVDASARSCSLPDQDAAAINLVSPETPDSLSGRSVVADVRVTIDAAGHVVAAAIQHSSRNSDADAAALVAARASAYRPARRNCETVSGDYTVQFVFN